MSKVRIIVKRTYQPPIETPASIRWQTIEVESEALFNLLVGGEAIGDKYHYWSSTVVGAEAIQEQVAE